MPNWTDAQLDAIKARRGTVLVSAAAGSGKTAVLVERVIERLTDLEHPTDADRLLVMSDGKLVLDGAPKDVFSRVEQMRLIGLDVPATTETLYELRAAGADVPLGALSDELDERFFRIGRAAIVNLSYIRRVTKTDAILSDGAAVPLPRGAYEALNRAIIAYH